ncbi:MAG TPA: OmpA family protein [Bacteroidia bacterium]|jgi:outer membrane protein OmpA-like peptidoglycan-associated protein|nr:OmpA family protein [Bacteroidia bacterium]
MFKFRSIFIIVFTVVVCIRLDAQINRGDMYYNSGQFARAIPAYEKGLKHGSDVQAMENLANCYRITKNYLKAEDWYSKTINANPNCNAVVYYYYSIVLRNNGKTSEAKQELQVFISKDPNDPKAQAQIHAIDNMQVWLAQTPIYAVKNVASINSPVSDISPVLFDDGLLFVSDRGQTDILNGDNEPYSGRAYYSIYYSKKKSEVDDSIIYGKADKLSRTINKDFHNGPVSVTADGNTMAFNRVDRQIKLRKKNFVNRPKIFFSTRKGKHWSDPVAFQYNSDAYSCSHPALSQDGQTLYFSSDMPGGMGGNDIWMSKKDGSGWGAPVNLGADVNSAGNEVFPYLRKDGTLFFSSDGIPGLGGLDIFTASYDQGKWTNVTNQGAPLNSATDDFEMMFNAEGTRGYFSSDRPGGAGDDDVYSFKVTAAFVSIHGHLLASKTTTDYVPNTVVELMSTDGKILKTTTTDAQGNFKFDNLSSDNSYLVRLNENDPAINAKPKYYMSDESGNLVRVTVLDEVGGKFTFEDLPAKSGEAAQLLSDDDYLTIAGNLLSDGDPPQPIANSNVKLEDDAGNVVQTTTTNAFGAFTFSRIPPDKNYIVTMDGNDPSLSASSRIIITNKSGQQIMSTTPDANGHFAFKILKEDMTTLSAMSVSDVDLRLDMKGTLVGADNNSTVLTGTTINILDNNGKVIESAKTDDKGHFDFTNLPADQAYLVSVDGVTDPGLVSFGKIYIKDEYGKILKTLRISAGGKFEFRILPLDRTTLGSVYVDDPWLQVMQMKAKAKKDSILIIENIYYNYNDWHILPAAEITLQKVAKVMELDPGITIEISSHTDSRGSDAANMTLSQKRAQAVVDYLVKLGVSKTRLVAIGYGETKLLNRCGNGVDCSEDEHAKNRRTEFKINKK